MEKLITVEVEQATELEAESIEQVTELEATYELSGGIIPTGTKQINITSNGTTTEDVTNYADAEITVNVQGGITPTGTKQITIDSSGTTTEDVTNYASVEVTVPSGSASTPSTSITANPSISVSGSGLITATASASQSVTPTVSEGWVSSGSAGTISVSGSNTSQLSTQGAATITPTTSQQTAVASGKYTTGNVVVDPIPSQYIIPSGTKSISANGTGIDVTQYASVDVAVTGSSGISGTFTPSSDTNSYTISDLVNTTYNHFMITATPSPSSVTGNAKRSFSAGVVSFEDSLTFSIATASNGTSVNTIHVNASSSSSVFSLNRTTGVVKASTGSNGGGYFIHDVTYKWYAW